jgi:hypothetical protein
MPFDHSLLRAWLCHIEGRLDFQRWLMLYIIWYWDFVYDKSNNRLKVKKVFFFFYDDILILRSFVKRIKNLKLSKENKLSFSTCVVLTCIMLERIWKWWCSFYDKRERSSSLKKIPSKLKSDKIERRKNSIYVDAIIVSSNILFIHHHHLTL